MTVAKEWQKLLLAAGVFLICFHLPVGAARFNAAVVESLHLVRWYAREHVLLCLVPAFFIAGAIGVFISQAAVMKYLGARAHKGIAYGVASVSGTILAVCSCTVLPLFAGIYRMGAGLGPACAFLYAGPAINVLAIVLTARILGPQMGLARALGAVVFSIVIGLLMHLIFRHEETEKATSQAALPEAEVTRPLWQNGIYFALMVGILVSANWSRPSAFRFTLIDGSTVTGTIVQSPADAAVPGATYHVRSSAADGGELELAAADVAERVLLPGFWTSVWEHKWGITAVFAVLLAAVLAAWFGLAWWKLAFTGVVVLGLALGMPTHGNWVLLPFGVAIIGLAVTLNTGPPEMREWLDTSWTFALQILPLLLGGVMVAGLLLGRVGHEGLIPDAWVAGLVGGNSIGANLAASVIGAFMYFATLTEVPILQGLIGAGMGKGPALALLLAGPALSLPNMLVIRSIMGTKKTVVFVTLVILMAAASGLVFGVIAT